MLFFISLYNLKYQIDLKRGTVMKIRRNVLDVCNAVHRNELGYVCFIVVLPLSGRGERHVRLR